MNFEPFWSIAYALRNEPVIEEIPKYVPNPEYERKRKELEVEALQREVDSLSRILSEKENRLKKLKEDLDNKKQ